MSAQEQAEQLFPAWPLTERAMSSLDKALTSTGMVVVPAEAVAEKIVEAARNEPDNLFLDEGLLKESVS
jgi:hypothetical protein